MMLIIFFNSEYESKRTGAKRQKFEFSRSARPMILQFKLPLTIVPVPNCTAGWWDRGMEKEQLPRPSFHAARGVVGEAEFLNE